MQTDNVFQNMIIILTPEGKQIQLKATNTGLEIIGASGLNVSVLS